MTSLEAELELLNMDQVKIDPGWALRIPPQLALRRQLLPFAKIGDKVLVACRDAADAQGLQAVERYVESPVEPQLADPESLDRAIGRVFRDAALGSTNPAAPLRTSFAARPGTAEQEGGDVVALGDEIFHAAHIRQATDIHIEPGENDVRVRLRVDGVMEEYRRIPAAIHQGLISRLKVLAGMDIAERRAPQDGRFSIGADPGPAIDVRAATIPTKHGERMTLRLLATTTQQLTLESLGMSVRDLKLFEQAIEQPNGLIVLTGPTGCGKTTTLYAALRLLISRRSLNVITIEDPVEYVIDGVSQVEVDAADKVSFHKALRAVLRHDPDVLMIGEIRDEETAEIAVKAALTGHLVFTTLHTNSAITTVSRLVDMGIKPFLVGAISRLYLAQRLVRKICPNCGTPRTLSDEQAAGLGRPELAGTTVFEPAGCKYCAGTGIAGRTGIFELISFDRNLAKLVADRKSETDIVHYLSASGNPFLLDDAIEKLRAGVTTCEELVGTVSL